MSRTTTREKAVGRGKAPASAAVKPPWRFGRASGLQIFQAPALARLDWLVHGFSTRPGGVSELNGTRVLNLGFTEWDLREHVAKNRAKFFRAIGADEMHVITLRQIHSDIVHCVSESNAVTLANDPPQGDALFTRGPGILLGVQTADCVPIFLVDTKQHAIAAIHSGWRGTVRRIAAKTLGRMQMEFGTRPEDVMAALGPGIGGCCYEVGSDVAREFHAQFAMAPEWFDGSFDGLASGESDPNWLPWLTMRPPGHPLPAPKVNLDLMAANRAILIEAGVPERQISDSGFCTACRRDLFFSYRRERTTGRMIAAIGVAER